MGEKRVAGVFPSSCGVSIGSEKMLSFEKDSMIPDIELEDVDDGLEIEEELVNEFTQRGGGDSEGVFHDEESEEDPAGFGDHELQRRVRHVVKSLR